MSQPAFKPVSIEEATAFVPIGADDLASLLTPKRGKAKPVPQIEKPRIPCVAARFVGGYLDGIERDIPEYYVTKGFLYRTINPDCRPERGMDLDKLFGECSSYRLGFQGTDGTYHFELVQEGGELASSDSGQL